MCIHFIIYKIIASIVVLHQKNLKKLLSSSGTWTWYNFVLMSSINFTLPSLNISNSPTIWLVRSDLDISSLLSDFCPYVHRVENHPNFFLILQWGTHHDAESTNFLQLLLVDWMLFSCITFTDHVTDECLVITEEGLICLKSLFQLPQPSHCMLVVIMKYYICIPYWVLGYLNEWVLHNFQSLIWFLYLLSQGIFLSQNYIFLASINNFFPNSASIKPGS